MIEYENLAHSNSAYMVELEDAAKRVIRSGWYVLGPEVKKFEENFAKYVGAKHCVGVANGLDALILSIEALDLPKGSDILVASNTYIATILAIIRSGNRPVLVEPDLHTFNIDPDNLTNAVTPKSRAVCVTHLFGKSCRMDKICVFAKKHNLKIIEDCAQSHGARLGEKQTGTFGDAGCFSFYPTKNLGAIGDAGAVVTNDEYLADRLRHIRNYGSNVKYVNEYIGVNSRLDEIQAALLGVKLKHFDQVITHKRALAEIYLAELPDWVTKPRVCVDEFDVFHIFGIRCERRDELRNYLLEHDIKTEIHYPIPPHRQKAFEGMFRQDFPKADVLHSTQLSLPISLGHTFEDINRVCDVIKKFN